ncbi:hypothetical protein NDS46_28045 [Paenibacillus thiaminolyticus]|uniref:hypothetical protein n=1 Tax=Paenibacillus thiaminolyticus TaxID=49283 RepID=UPI0023307735|nr:hypothetical protein [Paenibacillus thiaminolyticus]WCF08066.1 hypothetical protein NDS46_28045 [Paenibacillus thiaminolyticus]
MSQSTPKFKNIKIVFFLMFFLIVSNFLPSYTIGNETAMLIRSTLVTIFTPDSGRATTVYGICTLADAEDLVSGLERFAALRLHHFFA